MKKITTLALLATLAIAAPAFADDTPAGVASDVGAVGKDNQAINKSSSDLAKDRASKAANKANGNLGGQAVDSVKVGADKTMRSEKNMEKDHDKKTLKDDTNSVMGQ
jgi:hypothetical protein